VRTDRREVGIDGGTAILRRCLAGNPAISCPYRTQDRRLCVPAFRRVCPYIAKPVNTQRNVLAKCPLERTSPESDVHADAVAARGARLRAARKRPHQARSGVVGDSQVAEGSDRARRRPPFIENRGVRAEPAEFGISAGPAKSFIMPLSASATESASGAAHHARCDRLILFSLGAAAAGRGWRSRRGDIWIDWAARRRSAQ